MADDGWSFWKSEAKLSVLDPETRMRWLITVGGSAAALFLAGLFGNAISFDDWRGRAAALCVGAMLFPTYLCIDMLYKGRKAGTASRDARDSAIADRNAALDESKKPKKKRGDQNDVIKRYQRLVDAGLKINPQSSADLRDGNLK